ncbi:MAG: hypothetical protein QOK35_3500 [Pseudonocardiales bacterium]|nr:hypothetical protein [Pseudonocardiales bacterium]
MMRLGGLIRQIYDGACADYRAPRVHAELRLDLGERRFTPLEPHLWV